jgi:putative ABC transport system ATP-binding protein
VQPLIELAGASKIYNQGMANEVRALTDIDLVVPAGQLLCLKGPSGSGKSTLLAIMGCIFPPTSGRAAIAGKKLSRLPERYLTLHRRRSIGFIFQRFNLLPELSVLENITLPLLPLGVSPGQRQVLARALMERLGIGHRERFPARGISGGELQRVAIARALINDPPIILADEPTAHLDTALSREFMAIIAGLCQEGKTVVVASHDPLVFEHPAVQRVVRIREGRLHVS